MAYDGRDHSRQRGIAAGRQPAHDDVGRILLLQRL
jgi:hypothetical protein